VPRGEPLLARGVVAGAAPPHARLTRARVRWGRPQLFLRGRAHGRGHAYRARLRGRSRRTYACSAHTRSLVKERWWSRANACTAAHVSRGILTAIWCWSCAPGILEQYHKTSSIARGRTAGSSPGGPPHRLGESPTACGGLFSDISRTGMAPGTSRSSCRSTTHVCGLSRCLARRAGRPPGGGPNWVSRTPPLTARDHDRTR